MFEVTSVRKAESVTTKKVICYGFEYDVPVYVNYVAVDANGRIMGYFFEPKIVTLGYWSSTDDAPVEMGYVGFNGSWKESLIEV